MNFSMLLSRLLFPCTLLCGLLASSYLYQHWDVEDPANIAVVVLLVGAMWVWMWEMLLPYRNQWNKNDQDMATDGIHIAAALLVTKIAKPLYILLLFPAVTWLGQKLGTDNLWPHSWHWSAQLLLVLVLAEFGRYWVHRAAHSFLPLWNFHAVHHSPNRLYWLNAGRFHPVEKFYLQLPELLPFIFLGPSEEILMLYLVVNGLHGFFQHCNIQTRIGWLNYIFSMTELHRWHHSKVINESDNNFGNILILWDIVFGTFYWPKDREVGSIGVMNPEYPKHYMGQLLAPFGDKVDKPADYDERQDYYHQQAAHTDVKEVGS